MKYRKNKLHFKLCKSSVKWIHTFSNEPIWLYSELGDMRWEIRKVYMFPDGVFEYAGPNGNNGSTLLSFEPIPTLKEIASDPQFIANEISVDEFENVWKEALSQKL